MKLSVAIITYNHEEYIRQAVASVLAQNIGFPFELIIGEDCSTDGTRAVLEELDRENPGRLRLLLPTTNLGMIRNAAETLAACTGDYVAIVEGDDYWTDPNKLQQQVDFLDSHSKCSLCCHAVDYLYEDRSHAPQRFPVGVKPISTIEDLLGGTNFIQTCSLMFRRDRLPTLPDWLFSLRLADWPLCCILAQSGDIGFLDRVMAVYRVHPGNSWYHQPDTYRTEGVLRMYQHLRHHLDPKHAPQITRTLARFCVQLARLYGAAGAEEQALGFARDGIQHLLELGQPHLEDLQHVLCPLADAYRNVADLSSELRGVKAELRAIKASRMWRLQEAITRLPGIRQTSRLLGRWHSVPRPSVPAIAARDADSRRLGDCPD